VVYRHHIYSSSGLAEGENSMVKVHLGSDPTYQRTSKSCPECAHDEAIFMQVCAAKEALIGVFLESTKERGYEHETDVCVHESELWASMDGG
jgi:hypothetical protein